MDEKNIKLFAIWCARQVQHLMKDQRSIDALDIAERFFNNKCTIEELHAAADDADDAARNAVYAAATAVTCAADAVAYAARAAADAVIYATDAVTYAARADAYAAAATHDAITYTAVAAHDDAARATAHAVNKQIDKLLDFFQTQEKGLDYDWS